MSLFAKLRSIYSAEKFRIEDAHTEIVAQVLRNSRVLTLDWLKGIQATALDFPDTITISTQETFAKLDGHETDSKPDIVIRLTANGRKELIFIESKLPSKQGPGQLQRYSDHLTAAQQQENFASTSLIFITRDYEAASPELMSDPRFRLARWFEFYRYLKIHANGDGLARELMLFMEENRMSLGHYFRSTDLVALENFLSAKALMDEILDGEVLTKGDEILGGMTKNKALKELRQENRYVLASTGLNGMYCVLGFWLPHGSPDDSVWVGVQVFRDPKSTAAKNVQKAFRGWLSGAGNSWSGDNIEDDKAWSSIYKGDDLQFFLASPDHVRAIKDRLLTVLSEVGVFLQKYGLQGRTRVSVDDAAEEF